MKTMLAPSLALLTVFCASSVFAAPALRTETGQELGLSVSYYKFEVSDVDLDDEYRAYRYGTGWRQDWCGLHHHHGFAKRLVF